MIQEIGDRIFDNHYRPDIRMRKEDELFLFDEKSGEIGMKESEDGMLEIPKAGDAGLTEEECVYLFSIDDTRFFMPKSECSVSLPAGYEYRSPRVLRKGKPKDLCFAAMTAGHLNAWYKNRSDVRKMRNPDGIRREGTTDALSEVRGSYFFPELTRR